MAWISDDDASRLQLDERSLALHRRSIGCDLHVDMLLSRRLFGIDLRQEQRPGSLWRPRSLPFDLLRETLSSLGYHSPLYNHADLPRLRRGGYGLVGLGLHYWPRESERGYTEILRQLDLFDDLVRDNELVVAHNANAARKAIAEGKLAAFCGLEGAHCLGAAGEANEARRLARVAVLLSLIHI